MSFSSNNKTLDLYSLEIRFKELLVEISSMILFIITMGDYGIQATRSNKQVDFSICNILFVLIKLVHKVT